MGLGPFPRPAAAVSATAACCALVLAGCAGHAPVDPLRHGLKREASAPSPLLREDVAEEQLFQRLAGADEALSRDALLRLAKRGPRVLAGARRLLLEDMSLSRNKVLAALDLARHVFENGPPEDKDPDTTAFVSSLWRLWDSAGLELKREIVYTVSRIDPSPSAAQAVRAVLAGDPRITRRAVGLAKRSPSAPDLEGLVSALEDSERNPRVRREAAFALREITGQAFGYVPDEPPHLERDARARLRQAKTRAARRWRQWWDEEHARRRRASAGSG